MKKDSGSSGAGAETGAGRGKNAARICKTGFSQELLQKSSLTTQKAKTTLVGEPPFSDLYTAEIVSNSVQLGHGFGRVKLGTAHRGLGLRVDGFDSLLDVQKVDLD